MTGAAARGVLKTLRASAAKRRGDSEKAIEWALMKALYRMGFFVTKLSQPQRVKATAGVPDLLAMHRGWPRKDAEWSKDRTPPLQVFIEVKRPGCKPSTAQLVWHANARACGQNVIVAHNLTELLEGLKALGAPIT